MQHLRSFAALSAALLFVASPLAAQDNWGRGGVEVGVSYGVLNGIGNEFVDLDPVALEVDNNHYFAGRLGYVLKAGLGIEGFFGINPSADLLTSGQGGADVSVINYGGDLVWNFQPESAFQIFIMAGGGQQQVDVDPVPSGDPDSESWFAWNYGAGVKLFVSRNLALRVDWRNYIAPTGPEGIRGFFNPGATLDLDESLTSTEWTAGFSLFVGGPADEDGDGVPDTDDLCPGTDSGVAVDSNGCPFDDDGDGVYNHLDQCPDTPSGAAVDANGCPTDGDGDGVFDGIDQCPDTPSGAAVDENGCPTDSDGDGVFDGIDQCDDTPSGAVVDATGCPTDSDGDGVLDGIDKCPGTPAGREVDADGCGEFEAALAQGRLVLTGVQFEFNSADIKEESQADLDRAATAIRSAIANGRVIHLAGPWRTTGRASSASVLPSRGARTRR
ncbi:MAG: outer membrane beta-barrel protein, partial [Gemmatimonadota bacterium]